ncbi:TM1812 family CRISPR-associated protein [Halocatena salina]|uniref:TIGR02221 family CRISPR-associated protein n=1 Tax=Halocatena salina TaxID=2934340 RepID=A0A8U0A090_9EURY|nr:TM1812 family CRISPR-associated protein [Halocatena salina]UPM42482.1 hypothetical protein MW046_11025 [Halocatena salina]
MNEETLLVSSMGTGGKDGYSETDYALDDDSYSTEFSPVALSELVEVDRALVARTEEAADEYDEELEQAFGEVNVPCEFEDISDVENREEIDALMQRLIEMIRERDPDRVVLDITYGFRTLPMVFFTTIMHLDALDDIELARIYYGKFQGKNEESPIIDMTYLHTLMEWYHAVNTFKRTGELRPIHALLEERKGKLYKGSDKINPTNLDDFVSGLGGTSQNLDGGLPLKAGTAARSTLNEIETIEDGQLIGPEERFLNPLSDLLERTAVEGSSRNWNEISLDFDEIHRQREIIRFYVKKGQYRVALECARELFINRVILEERADLDNWLDDNGIRDTVTEQLGKQREKQKNTDMEIAAISLWNQLGNYRNWYAHSGFKTEDKPTDTKIESTLSELCEKIDDDEYWSEII